VTFWPIAPGLHEGRLPGKSGVGLNDDDGRIAAINVPMGSLRTLPPLLAGAMCNLYTNKASAAEVAALFKAQIPINFNAGEGDVYPGGQGMIVRGENRARIVQSMVWGWPRPMKSKVIGAIVHRLGLSRRVDHDRADGGAVVQAQISGDAGFAGLSWGVKQTVTTISI
jgi:hypothetical protein